MGSRAAGMLAGQADVLGLLGALGPAGSQCPYGKTQDLSAAGGSSLGWWEAGWLQLPGCTTGLGEQEGAPDSWDFSHMGWESSLNPNHCIPLELLELREHPEP